MKKLLFLFFLLLPISALGAEILATGDAVISKDTTWSGIINIKGVVVVGRGVTLTIAPGTMIKFERIDINHDGIGDGEIRVLGRLLAQGTAQRPIVFQSAEANPAPKDWSYLLIFTSGQKNVVKYCQFHQAFTGLQVHFSTTEVANCLFSDNNEGLRFGRAKLIVKHNVFEKNNIGVRFTRMEGPAEIKFNEISNNNVGIFLVPSGQNILDFFDPGHTGKPWNEGHLAIYKNNIYANHDYNLKLGAKQKWNLNISDNWWGSTEQETIMNKIFDNHRDSALGKAFINPTIGQKISSAGMVSPLCNTGQTP